MAESILPPLTPYQRSPAMFQAVQMLRNVYFTAATIVSTGDFEAQRIQHHIKEITETALPLLVSIESMAEDEHIPQEWLEECSKKFSVLFIELSNAEKAARGSESSNVQIPQPITIHHTGRRGRPKIYVDPSFLREVTDSHRNIYLSRLASRLKISPNVLRQQIKDLGIDRGFSKIPDDALDDIVGEFRRKHGIASGAGYVVGHVRSQGIRVQRQRIRDSISRVDRLSKTLRRTIKAKTARRNYNVSRPNALWHIDGHHKLIAWGFVIHGCVDGFSRTITGLRASTNNRASTVLELFLDAIMKYGIPSRVRGDRGGENRDVAILMILLRGLYRASFMWGSSTHNTRIERLWVEVGTQFARQWRAFFLRLEKYHLLDRSDPHHLWLLHLLFLDAINKDCGDFCKGWNAHPISGKAFGQSPNDIRLLGQLDFGIYADDCDRMDVEEIERYYGVQGRPVRRAQGRSGAGHPPDEDECLPIVADGEEDMEWEDLDEGIVNEADPNIRHKPVPVPKHASPFSDKEMEDFRAVMVQMAEANHIPSGYGMLESEWESGIYPTMFSIPGVLFMSSKRPHLKLKKKRKAVARSQLSLSRRTSSRSRKSSANSTGGSRRAHKADSDHDTAMLSDNDIESSGSDSSDTTPLSSIVTKKTSLAISGSSSNDSNTVGTTLSTFLSRNASMGGVKDRNLQVLQNLIEAKNSGTEQYELAEAEARRGLKRPTEALATSKKIERFSSRTKGKQKATSPKDDHSFKVSSIIVLPIGTTKGPCPSVTGECDDESLTSVVDSIPDPTKVPSEVLLEVLEKQGLCITDTENGFEFSADWDYDSISDALASHLPLLFRWFEEGPFSVQYAETPTESPWLLLSKKNSKLTVVPFASNKADLNGTKLARHCVVKKASWMSNKLYLVTKDPIPAFILNEWIKGNHTMTIPLKRKRSISDASDPAADLSDSECAIASPPSRPPPRKRLSRAAAFTKTYDIDSDSGDDRANENMSDQDVGVIAPIIDLTTSDQEHAENAVAGPSRLPDTRASTPFIDDTRYDHDLLLEFSRASTSFSNLNFNSWGDDQDLEVE